MIAAGDFRNGVTIEFEGNIYQIIEFQHVKPGKGAAFVRCKIKNIKTGGVVERTFRPSEKLPKAHIERKDMQYLYAKFVRENEMVKIASHQGTVFAIEPPLSVELEITETEPGIKGDTAQGATKPATVETGARVMVPLFINQGEVIRIDTRTGEYTGRA